MRTFTGWFALACCLPIVSPVVSSAHAAEAGFDGAAIRRYIASDEDPQVTSINQFSDIRPDEWAYQALHNLVERYGCVAGYPDGTFRGGLPITRFEAAALLNACLDRITEVTDELKRLLKELEKELAVVRGRVDGLEARIGELEAMAFATTTKLMGVTAMYLNTASGPNKAVSSAIQRRNSSPASGLDARHTAFAWAAKGSDTAQLHISWGSPTRCTSR